MFCGGSQTLYSTGQVVPVLPWFARSQLVPDEERVSSSQGMWRHQTAAGPGLITDANAA